MQHIAETLAERLSNRDISILCDVGQTPGKIFSGPKRDDLRRLIDEGFVKRCDDEAEIYTLTAKGQQALGDRGAGLNES